MADLKNTEINDNLELPSGTTAQRPSSPQEGQIRYNTDLETVEFYNGANWRPLSDTHPEATGGTVVDTYIGGVPYRIHYFTETGTDTLTVTNPGPVDALIVAGGGGGGSGNPDRGGGGAGGVILRQGYYLDTQSYSVTLGDGAEGGNNNNPNNGGDSVFGSLTALGGGSADGFGDGNSGGSGGAGGGGGAGGAATQPSSSLTGFGNSGGSGSRELNDDGSNAAGGGGGAGGPGQDGSSDNGSDGPAGNGGPGIYIGNLFPSAGVNGFIAGGGGGSSSSGPNGFGGVGGGTDGAGRGTADDAPSNTGSGAGGAENGGRGGSGIVIVRYPRNSSLDTEPDRTVIATQPQNFQTVRDGLVLELDAGNPVSYPGSGSTWRDLSAIANNGSLENGVSYDSVNGGVLVFDGSNQYVGMGRSYIDSGEIGTGDVSYTLEAWFKLEREVNWGTGTLDGPSIIGSASSRGIGFQLNQNGDDAFVNFGARRNNNFDSSSTIDPYRWYHVVCTREVEENNRIYINGELDQTFSISNLDVDSTDNEMQIGYADGRLDNVYFQGKIAVARLYNTFLTDEQVLQNFNAERGRYGI